MMDSFRSIIETYYSKEGDPYPSASCDTLLDKLNSLFLREEGSEELVMKKCIKDSFKIKEIPYNLALLFATFIDTGGTGDVGERHARMGELLRMAHAASEEFKYSPQGKKEPNYQRDVGYISSSHDDLIPLLSQYNLVGMRLPNGKVLFIPQSIYDAEKFVSESLLDTKAIIKLPVSYPCQESIKASIEKRGYIAAPQLVHIIKEILNERITVVLGGAGTGKTGVVEVVYDLCKQVGVEVFICSFTGKSIANITGRIYCTTASTIHSLISRIGSETPKRIFLVIEECSMVSTSLIYLLFKKFRGQGILFQLLLIGDRHQLPPIEWGMFFISVIRSGKFPIHELSHNYRSRETIIRNAELFKQESKSTNISHFILSPSFTILDKEKVQAFYLSLPSPDYIVITPWVKERNMINDEVQRLLNPFSPVIVKTKSLKLFKGDRVVFNENFSNEGVFNGTGGIVKGIEYLLIPEEKGKGFGLSCLGKDGRYYRYTPNRFFTHVIVKTAAKEVRVPVAVRTKDSSSNPREINHPDYPTIENLELAYALTTHKAQGSEWKYVLFKADTLPSQYIPGGRANVYTAITRARHAFFFRFYDNCENMKTIPIGNDQLPYMLSE